MSRRLLGLLLFLCLFACGLVPVLQARATDVAAYRRAGATLAAHHDPWEGGEPRYLYPPLLAALFAPLHRLPDLPVAVVWTGLSALAMAFAALRLAPRRALLVALLFAPLYATQWNAQANGWVLLALVLARERLAITDEDGGGAWWGLSVAIKPLALPAALGLLLAGYARAFLFGLAVIVLSFLSVVPFLGWRGVSTAVGHVARILKATWPDAWPANVSLSGTLDRFFPAGAGTHRHLVVAAAVLGLTALLGLVKGRKAGAVLMLDAFLAGTLLAAGASWLHHAAVLLPLTAVLPIAGPVSAALFAAAAGWRFALVLWPAHGAPAAAASGTAALALLWGAALVRIGRAE